MALTVAIFLIIFWRIPFGAFWQALSRAQLLPFLALMGSFSLCFFLLDTFVLSKLIRWFHGPLPYRELLPVRAVTYLVSIINTQLAQGHWPSTCTAASAPRWRRSRAQWRS